MHARTLPSRIAGCGGGEAGVAVAARSQGGEEATHADCGGVRDEGQGKWVGAKVDGRMAERKNCLQA